MKYYKTDSDIETNNGELAQLQNETEAPKLAAVILCAGSGVRTGLPYNKILHNIGGRSIFEITLNAFAKFGKFSKILIVSSDDDYELITETAIKYGASVCIGGFTRTESVRKALQVLSDDTDFVLIHDGARPFVSQDLIGRVVESTITRGSGIPATAVIDAVKVVYDDVITTSLPKNQLRNVQTPQGFDLKLLKKAYETVEGSYGDDSEVYALAGFMPYIVEGEYSNRKITTQADIFNLATSYKIGYGYDVHPLVTGRDLILGGVYFEHDKGLYGHSDADVLTHAIMDALLSAAGLPDIGVIFPNTDPKYENCSSIKMLKQVRDMLSKTNNKILGISAVIMAERPKMAKHIPNMINVLSTALNISPSAINISATTTEKLGIVGEERGIAASATALLSM